MSAKLLIYPRGMKMSRKLKKTLEDSGYILVPEDEAGSVKVVDPLPDMQLNDGEAAWMMNTMLDLIQNHSYTNQKERLASRMLKRVQDKIQKACPPEEVTPPLKIASKAS